MRRRIALIAVFLILGAIVNIAVAWGCALTMPASTPVLGGSEWQSWYWRTHSHNWPACTESGAAVRAPAQTAGKPAAM